MSLTRTVSRTEVTLVAMAVSLVASWMVWHTHLIQRVAPAPSTQRQELPAPIVYGTGLAHLNGDSHEMTCTAMASNTGGEYCTSWTLLAPGQRAVQAAPLPVGANCAAVEADQQSGRWVCTTGP
jgi:hypothetical protein